MSAPGGKDPWFAYGVRVTDAKTLEAWKRWCEAHPNPDSTSRALFVAIFEWIRSASDPRNFQ